MFEITVVVAVIVGLIEAIKRTGYLPSRFSALVAIAFGVVYTLFIEAGGAVGTDVFAGVVLGLTASGLYSGTKATIRG